jgi:hypothetical protein
MHIFLFNMIKLSSTVFYNVLHLDEHILCATGCNRSATQVFTVVTMSIPSAEVCHCVDAKNKGGGIRNFGAVTCPPAPRKQLY